MVNVNDSSTGLNLQGDHHTIGLHWASSSILAMCLAGHSYF